MAERFEINRGGTIDTAGVHPRTPIDSYTLPERTRPCLGRELGVKADRLVTVSERPSALLGPGADTMVGIAAIAYSRRYSDRGNGLFELPSRLLARATVARYPETVTIDQVRLPTSLGIFVTACLLQAATGQGAELAIDERLLASDTLEPLRAGLGLDVSPKGKVISGPNNKKPIEVSRCTDYGAAHHSPEGIAYRHVLLRTGDVHRVAGDIIDEGTRRSHT